jgi:hypothetical protein
MRSRAQRRYKVPTTVLCVAGLIAVAAQSAGAEDTTPVTNDTRMGAVFAHPIIGDFDGKPYVWFDDQTGGVKSLRVSFPDVIYRARPWLEGWGGLSVTWKDNEASGNTRELRPYVGVKVFLPNSAHIRLYDLTRFEWRRITNTDSDTITREQRLRTLPGVEFPLSERAWQPRTFYGLANVEMFVQNNFVNSLRFASGVGYIGKDRIRLEFQYVALLSRKSSGDQLAYSGNSFRLDLKFSFKQGLINTLEGSE